MLCSVTSDGDREGWKHKRNSLNSTGAIIIINNKKKNVNSGEVREGERQYGEETSSTCFIMIGEVKMGLMM